MSVSYPPLRLLSISDGMPSFPSPCWSTDHQCAARNCRFVAKRKQKHAGDVLCYVHLGKVRLAAQTLALKSWLWHLIWRKGGDHKALTEMGGGI